MSFIITPDKKRAEDGIGEYLEYFERVAKVNAWDDAMAAKILPGLLEVGCTVLSDLDATVLASLNNIKAELGPKVECFRDVEVKRFFALEKKQNESVKDYFKVCKTIVSTCYGKFAKANQDLLVRDRFIHGLSQQMKMIVLNHKHAKAEEAVESALMAEAIDGSFREKRPFSRDNDEKKTTGIAMSGSPKYMGGPSNRSHGQGVTCYNCQGIGHFARFCPQRSSTSRNRVHAIENVQRPMVNAVLNGMKIQMLVDTGACISILPSSQFRCNGDATGMFSTATGTPIKVEGMLDAHVQVDDWELKHTFYVGDVSRAVLGMDFLKRHEMVFEAATGQLKMGSHTDLGINQERGDTHYTTTELESMADVTGVYMISAEELAPEIKDSDGSIYETNEDQDMIKLLKNKFKAVFSGLGHVKSICHNIEVDDNEPINLPSHRLPIHLVKKAQETLFKLEDGGIIRKSGSAWCSPVVLVPKKNGDVRVAIDFRQLNKRCKLDAYPMPRIDECLEKLQGATVYSVLDCNSGYYQIDIAQEDRAKTAFRFGGQLWEFTRMPFGLKSAPATFCRLMHRAFVNERNVVTYLDDICVFSKSVEEHKKHLERAFEILQKMGLTLNVDKCKFMQSAIEFLGFSVSGDKIQPLESKWRAMVKFPRPKNANEVKQFLGLVGYYRRLIPQFAVLAAPLYDLTSSKKKFSWEKRQEEAFDKVREALRSNVMLMLPDFKKKFIVRTDACMEGIGALLVQEDENGQRRVVECASKKFQETHKRYSVIEQEAYAIVFALDKWEHFLIGKEFVLETDHRPLVWLQSKKDCRGKLGRWALRLAPFTFTTVHIPGRMNADADALSRMAVCSIGADHKTLHQQQEDDLILKRAIEREPSKYKEINGLWYRCEEKEILLCIPKSERENVWKSVHDELGHGGEGKVHDIVKKRFYWPKMRNDIKGWLKKCQQCGLNKDFGPRPARVPMVEVDQSQLNPMERVAIDVMGPFPEDNHGRRYLLVLMDCFTKWVEAKPVTTIRTSDIVRWLKEDIFARFAIPREIILDCGANMESIEMKTFCRELGIKLVYTTVYHHQSNPVEQVNRTLVNMLRNYVSENQADWSEHIPLVLFSCRVTKHKATQRSPYEVLFGLQPRLPIDLKYATQTGTPDSVKEIIERMANTRRSVRKQLEKAASRMSQSYNTTHKVQEPTFQLGDLVYQKRYQFERGTNRKLSAQWTGPFKLIERMSKVNWRIGGCTSKTRIVHDNLLKICQLDSVGMQLQEIRGRGRPRTW